MTSHDKNIQVENRIAIYGHAMKCTACNKITEFMDIRKYEKGVKYEFWCYGCCGQGGPDMPHKRIGLELDGQMYGFHIEKL